MKVCIIGTGLTSLCLAKALINQGINVELFAKNMNNFYDKAQTLGITKSNIEFFNNNILNIDKLLWKINKIEIYSENLQNDKILNFENKDQQLFSIIKNYKLYDYLLSDLKKNKLFLVKKTSSHLINNNNYNLIINSDINSPITKKFLHKRISKKYNSYGHVTIIRHQKISNNTAIQVFTKKGPIAFLPISKYETSIVYSARGKKNIEKTELENLIKKNFQKVEIKKIGNFKSFELKSINLRNYYYKNILAFGDLLHKIHPLAGQGFNMVIRDINVLLNLINYKINLGIQLDNSICSEFEKKSKTQNFLFSSSIDFVYEFFNFESKSKIKLMSKSVQFFGKNKSINKFLIRLADSGNII